MERSITILTFMSVFIVVLGAVAGGAVAAADGDAAATNETTTDPIDEVDRTVADTAAPGDTVDVSISVNLNETATNFQITDEFDPAVADLRIVDDDGATVSESTDNNDVITGSWGSVDEVTLQYELDVAEEAEPGEIEIDGVVTADGTEVDTGTDTVSISIVESTERDVAAGAKPGETVSAEVSAELSTVVTDLDLTETFDPSVDSLSVVNDDGATVSTSTDANDQLIASWGDVENVTLAYEFTIPDNATQGDTYDVFGTLETGNATVTVSTDEVVVSDRPEAVEYADEETGTVTPGGLGSAASDFRDGTIDPSAIGEIAAAFRSGDEVR